MKSLLSLQVQPGENLSAEKWNSLLREIETRTLRRGSKDVLLSRGPDSTKVKFRGGNKKGALPATPLRVTLTDTDDEKLAATVTKGLIGGIEPQIKDTPVSQLDNDGNPPSFVFDPATAIDAKTGIGMLYARLAMRPDWSIQKIELEARSTPPLITAWTGYKLLCFLRRTPAEDPKGAVVPIQRVFFDLGHTTSQRGANGKGRHWFWAM